MKGEGEEEEEGEEWSRFCIHHHISCSGFHTQASSHSWTQWHPKAWGRAAVVPEYLLCNDCSPPPPPWGATASRVPFPTPHTLGATAFMVALTYTPHLLPLPPLTLGATASMSALPRLGAVA